jgi:diguanylate cyclase
MDCSFPGTDECERSLALAEVVRSSLLANGLPPTPRNYELWYTYELKNNPALMRDIDALLAAQGVPSESDLDGLYEIHFGPARMLGRMQVIGAGLSGRLGDVVGLVSAALGSASAYGDSLDAATRKLAASDDRAAILAVVRALAAATLEMCEQGVGLKARLEGADREIAELQQDLQAIRMESRLDPLTELGNRKHFDEAMIRAVKASREQDEALSLLLIDIDHFKSFNDTYGHATGDQVLRLVAMSLRQNLKGQDVAARYGGEEFAIVLPKTALNRAFTVADQLRRVVMARELKKKSTGEIIGRVTVSIGVASLLAYDTGESLIERADNCLYAAKRSGRNRVVSAEQFREAAAANVT